MEKNEMSPLITSQNMNDAYIIDDLLSRPHPHPHPGSSSLPRARVAQGDEWSSLKQMGTQSGTDPEAEGPY